MNEETKFLPASSATIPETFKSQEDIVLENCIEKEYKKILSPAYARKYGRSQSDTEKYKSGWKRFTGIAFVILSGLCFTLISFVSAYFNHKLDYNWRNYISWSLFVSFTISILILIYFVIIKKSQVFYGLWCYGSSSATIVQYRRRDLQTRQRNITTILTIVAGIFSGAAVILRSLSISHLPDHVVNHIFWYAVIIAILVLGHLCLKNGKLKIVLTILTLFTLTGILLSIWPKIKDQYNGFGNIFVVEYIYGISSTLCISFVIIILQKIRIVHFSIILSWLGCCGLIFSTIAFTIQLGIDSFKIPTGLQDLMLMIALGVCTFGTQLFFILALKHEEALPVCLCFCSELIFSCILEKIQSDQDFHIYKIIGALVILICIAIVCIRRYMLTLPADNELKQICIKYSL